MNSLSDKPGVLGGLSSVGNVISQGAKQEVQKTLENTVEQLGLKENKEKEPTEADMAAQAEAMKKQSQEMTSWLYGTPSTEFPPAAPVATEQKPIIQSEIKQQLGLEMKNGNPQSASEQLGMKPQTNTNTENLVEQLGMGQGNQASASLADQLRVPGSAPAADQQNPQLRQQLHNDYYQRLTHPQPQQSDTEERQKETQEEQENAAQRMARLEQEDLQRKQEKSEKEKPIAAVDQAQNAEKHRGSMG